MELNIASRRSTVGILWLKPIAMEPCLLCDVNSVRRGSGTVAICDIHRQQAEAAFQHAEPALRSHLEQSFGAELDEWVRAGRVPGLAWHLQIRDHAPEPTSELARGRAGRPVHFEREPELAVRLMRELLVKAMEQQAFPQEPAIVLRVGTADGRRTASVDMTTLQEAVQFLVADLLTVERVQMALNNLPTDAAGRAIIQAMLAGHDEPDAVVRELGLVSPGARALAFVRLLDRGDTLLVDPIEIAGEAEGGSAEFVRGWWEIRDKIPEPGRQWVELLEGRYPRARNR